MHSAASCGAPGPRPRYEVADVVRLCREELSRTVALTNEQRKVLRALSRCRTAELGGHLDVCDGCGHERPCYNSCRNRHCPKCQALAQERWLRARRERILPVHHFHVVFTLPGELRPVVRCNPRLLYGLLMRSASTTLLELGRDDKRLGAELGVTAVLHTWRRDLAFHPHVHCVVPGGGLDREGHWRSTMPGYLFPVRVLGALFRGKFLHALGRLFARGALVLPDELSAPGAFAALLSRLYHKSWLVYAKPPFGGAESVFAYLGRYTHRIGISNARLLSVTEREVTFRTRGDKKATMPPCVFVARFLQHVLPRGFVRIRHAGLLGSTNVRTRLTVARRALDASHKVSPCTTVEAAREPATESPSEPSNEHDDPPDWVRLYREMTGIDLALCPRCHGAMLRLRLAPSSQPRAPP